MAVGLISKFLGRGALKAGVTGATVAGVGSVLGSGLSALKQGAMNSISGALSAIPGASAVGSVAKSFKEGFGAARSEGGSKRSSSSPVGSAKADVATKVNIPTGDNPELILLAGILESIQNLTNTNAAGLEAEERQGRFLVSAFDSLGDAIDGVRESMLGMAAAIDDEPVAAPPPIEQEKGSNLPILLAGLAAAIGSAFNTSIAEALGGGGDGAPVEGAAGNAAAKMLQGAATVTPAAARAAGSAATKVSAAAVRRVAPKAAERVSQAAARVGGTAMAQKVGGIVAKATGSSIAKKIPVLGAVAGGALGLMRYMEGDTTGAALEVASGISSMVPGVGTVASVIQDLNILARDLKRAMGKESAGGSMPDSIYDNFTLSNPTGYVDGITYTAQQFPDAIPTDVLDKLKSMVLMTASEKQAPRVIGQTESGENIVEFERERQTRRGSRTETVQATQSEFDEYMASRGAQPSAMDAAVAQLTDVASGASSLAGRVVDTAKDIGGDVIKQGAAMIGMASDQFGSASAGFAQSVAAFSKIIQSMPMTSGGGSGPATIMPSASGSPDSLHNPQL